MTCDELITDVHTYVHFIVAIKCTISVLSMTLYHFAYPTLSADTCLFGKALHRTVQFPNNNNSIKTLVIVAILYFMMLQPFVLK